MPPPNPKENIIYFSSDWRMSACSYFKGCIDCLASKQKTDKSFSVAIIMLPTFFIFINKLNEIKTLIFLTQPGKEMCIINRQWQAQTRSHSQ